jgi:hypothetical protein
MRAAIRALLLALLSACGANDEMCFGWTHLVEPTGPDGLADDLAVGVEGRVPTLESSPSLHSAASPNEWPATLPSEIAV